MLVIDSNADLASLESEYLSARDKIIRMAAVEGGNNRKLGTEGKDGKVAA